MPVDSAGCAFFSFFLPEDQKTHGDTRSSFEASSAAAPDKRDEGSSRARAGPKSSFDSRSIRQVLRWFGGSRLMVECVVIVSNRSGSPMRERERGRRRRGEIFATSCGRSGAASARPRFSNPIGRNHLPSFLPSSLLLSRADNIQAPKKNRQSIDSRNKF